MIAVDAEPYLMVHRPGFTNLMKIVAPRYRMPCRKVFSEKVVPGIYEELKSQVIFSET